ncbi:hypothetical protein YASMINEVIRUS_810 [Yasminevirus sp. GU-2018]|uniref:ABC transporter domain-containing protein n=1 Tax=Yasminevirus sp. GU-2018 TaxID=2420051 RepID=A0A5K0U8W3_9VIRU|nr:hypothetical protein YASMINEVIRUS_810 [Yasminevirus sp. GU-2018]
MIKSSVETVTYLLTYLSSAKQKVGKLVATKPGKNPIVDVVKHSLNDKRGRQVYGVFAFVLILAYRSIISKKRDVKNIMSFVPSHLMNLSGQEKQRRLGFNDYLQIIRQCQHEDSSLYPSLLIYTSVLVSRIVLTTKLMENISTTVKFMTKKNWDGMFKSQYKFVLICLPSMILVGVQNFLEKFVETKIRASLTTSLTKKYFASKRYYRVTDQQIDKVMSNDTEGFSREFMHCYHGVVKPSTDVVYLSAVISRKIGVMNMIKFYAYFFGVANVLNMLKLPFSKLYKYKLALESDFKTNLSRTREYVEPIAFLNGGETEMRISDTKLKNVSDYANMLAVYKMVPDMLDAFFIKYGGMMIGFLIILPKVYSGNFKGDSSDITEHYTFSSGMLTTLGKTVVELISVQKDLHILDGLASRIRDAYEKLSSLKDTKDGVNFSTGIDQSTSMTRCEDTIKITNLSVTTPTSDTSSNTLSTSSTSSDLSNESVAKKYLIENLTIDVKKGDSLVVVGSNGTGKTSLFRTLAGLWDAQNSDKIVLPKKTKFIPQRPYFTIDDFYSSIVYPKTQVSDSDKKVIDELVNEVGMSDVVKRYNTTERVDWTEKLSGGEKQRLAIVRALYDYPDFCIMDEATSAMSNDVEEKIFKLCLSRGVTLISIVHKESLEKFHQKQLRLLGGGAWSYDTINV